MRSREFGIMICQFIPNFVKDIIISNKIGNFRSERGKKSMPEKLVLSDPEGMICASFQ